MKINPGISPKSKELRNNTWDVKFGWSGSELGENQLNDLVPNSKFTCKKVKTIQQECVGLLLPQVSSIRSKKLINIDAYL